MLDFHNDPTIKFEHSQVITYERDNENACGATTSAIRQLDFTPSNSNSIFVSEDAADGSPDGTQEHPYVTITAAIAECDATHQAVVVLDSAIYTEGLIQPHGDFLGLYAAEGETPTLTLSYNYENIFSDQDPELGETTITISANKIIELTNGNIVIAVTNCTSAKIYQQNGTYIGALSNTPTGGSGGICALNNSKFAIVTRNGSQITIYIYNSSGTLTNSYTESTYLCDNTSIVYPFKLSNGNIGIIYQQYMQMDTFINEYSASTAGLVTSIEKTYGIRPVGVSIFSNNNILCVCEHGSSSGAHDGYGYIVFNTAYDILKAQLLPISEVQGIGLGIFKDVFVTSDDHGVIVWEIDSDYDDAYCVYRVIDNGGDILYLENSLIVDLDTEQYIKVIAKPGGGILVFYKDTITGDTAFKYIQEDGTIEIANGGILTDQYIDIAFALSNNDIVIAYTVAGPAYKMMILSSTWYSGLESNIAFELNGFVIDSAESYEVDNLFWFKGASATVKYNTFKNLEQPAGTEQSIIRSEGNLIFKWNIIQDCNKGIVAEDNTIEIKENLFFRNTGKTVYIDGAGAGIDIQHNTFFDNVTDIELINNDGDEIIKNNIHHNSDVSITAENAVTYSDSIDTSGPAGAVVTGDNILDDNPDFVNEGAIDPDDIDLDLRMVVEGYDDNSPAYQAADDDDNMGGVLFDVVVFTSTWTDVTVQKSIEIEVWYESAGKILSVRQDGSVETSRKGITEYVHLKWRGLTNNEYDDLFALFNSDSNAVRIYPDPVTNPGDYNVYKLVYDKVTGAAKHYRLTRTGKQDFELTFARRYEVV